MKQEVANLLIETLCKVCDASITNNENIKTSASTDLITVNNVYFKLNEFKKSYSNDYNQILKLIEAISGTPTDNLFHKDYNMTYLFAGQFLLTLRIES